MKHSDAERLIAITAALARWTARDALKALGPGAARRYAQGV